MVWGYIKNNGTRKLIKTENIYYLKSQLLPEIAGGLLQYDGLSCHTPRVTYIILLTKTLQSYKIGLPKS